MTEQLTKMDKLEARWQAKLSPKLPDGSPLPFQSSEAEKTYGESILGSKMRSEMEKLPDRVPVTTFPGMFPWLSAGVAMEEAMYDYEKCHKPLRISCLRYQPDIHWGALGPGTGKMYEILDYKLYAWPGHGVAPEHVYQCKEDQYMKADEYDDLIHDPSGYFTQKYLPRVFRTLSGFPMLPFLPGILEIYGLGLNFIPYGLPPVQPPIGTV